MLSSSSEDIVITFLKHFAFRSNAGHMQKQSLLMIFSMGLYHTLMHLIFINLCFVVYTYTHNIDMEVRKQFAEVGSLLPPQGWIQVLKIILK